MADWRLGRDFGFTDLRRRRGAGGGTPIGPPAAFMFSDDFDTGAASIALRSGWDYRGNSGAYQAVQISAGELPLIDGYTVLPAALVDTGNVRGGSITGTLGASWTGSAATKYATLKFGFVDEGNYLEAYVNNGASLQLRRCVNGTITTVYTAAQVTTNSDVLRADWDWDGDTCTVLLWLNGARWPNDTTSWQIAASGGLMPSGRAGLGAKTTWSAVQIDAPAVAPRLTIARPSRLYQARPDGLRSIPIGGTCNGVAAIELRVTQGGNTLPGWDWGQVPIADLVIDGTSWSGAVPDLPRGTGYRIEVRSAGDADARSATWLIDIGDVIMIEGQSLAVAVMGGTGRTMAAQSNAWFPRYATGDTNMSPDDFNRQWGWAGLAPFATLTSDNDVRNSTLANTVGQIRAAGGTDGVLMRNIGRGSTAIAEFRPRSTLQPYANSPRNLTGLWHDALDALGGDCAALVWSQGQEDFGRNYVADTFGATEAAAYKSAFAEIIADRRAAAGRSAADLPVLICGLGRLYPPSGAQGDYACDAAYDLARRTQYELTIEVDNCHLSHSEMGPASDRNGPERGPPLAARLCRGGRADRGGSGEDLGAAIVGSARAVAGLGRGLWQQRRCDVRRQRRRLCYLLCSRRDKPRVLV